MSPRFADASLQITRAESREHCKDCRRLSTKPWTLSVDGDFMAEPSKGAVMQGTSTREIDIQTARERMTGYCYHGLSSLGAAQFLQRLGFVDVVSLSGGFDGWQRSS